MSHLLLKSTDRLGYRDGFSLVELLVVVGVISLLFALSGPALVSLTPSRKAGLSEVAGLLEYARSEAIAKQTEIYVAVADKSFPDPTMALRRYAVFEAEESGGAVDTQPVKQLSEWHELPVGLIFAGADQFDINPEVAFRTILESRERRSFPIRNKGEIPSHAELPYLLYGPRGKIFIPSFVNADALHIGLAEGFVDEERHEPVYTTRRSGQNTGGEFAQSECIGVAYYTGKARILTD